jgi:AraC-like DNA-binding protein
MVPSEWTFHNYASDLEISLTPDAEQLHLLFPAGVFCRKLMTTETKVMSFGASAGVPRLAGGFLRLLNSEWPYLSSGERTDMIYTAAQLVQLAIIEQQTVCRMTMQETLRERVKAYVARNLRDHRLTIEQIAAALGCTKRNLHKVFRGDAHTLSAFIWDLRLQRCAADFSDPSRARETITQIAFSWGFNNAAHFSRLFRERYAVSASRFRARVGTGDATGQAHLSAHRRRQGRTIDADGPATTH